MPNYRAAIGYSVATTGTFSEGASLTITGSGFGTGGIPVLFQDFETGSAGANLNTLGFSTTNSNGCPSPVVSTTRSYSGTKSGLADCLLGGDSAAYLSGLNATEIYVSLHLYGEKGTATDVTTVKGVRALGETGTGENVFTSYPGFFDQETLSQWSGNSHRLQINDKDTVGNVLIDYIGDFPSDAWGRQEYHYKLGTAGVADGFLRYWQDLVSLSATENFATRAAGSVQNIDRLMLPFYWGNATGGTAGVFYYDNIYIATGTNCAARVEAGDNAVYASCAKREIMNTTAREDTSVTFTVPSHTFTSGDTVYLYVLDGNSSVIGSPTSLVVA